MYRVRTINAISDVWRECLRESDYIVGPDVEDADAIIVRSADMHAMELPPSVRCVARAGAGYNNIPYEELGKKGVVVFNTPGANANAVKELAVAGMLIASRDIMGGIAWVKTLKGEGAAVGKLVENGKGRFAGPELMGKTLGVIGLGAVGALVANAGAGLDMRVLGVDPFISVEHAWALSRKVDRALSQEELLPLCDYVSVHVPLMDATRGSINAAKLSLMKPGAVLLNFSRGELVVEKDVLEALNNGRLRHYVTDFPTDAMLDHPGVIAIPHLGASTPESEDNCVRMACAQIDQYLKTGAIHNSVNYPACESGAWDGYRLCVLHANVPNVVSPVTAAVAARDINIDHMVNVSRGSLAYTMLTLGVRPDDELLRTISTPENIYAVRVL